MVVTFAEMLSSLFQSLWLQLAGCRLQSLGSGVLPDVTYKQEIKRKSNNKKQATTFITPALSCWNLLGKIGKHQMFLKASKERGPCPQTSTPDKMPLGLILGVVKSRALTTDLGLHPVFPAQSSGAWASWSVFLISHWGNSINLGDSWGADPKTQCHPVPTLEPPGGLTSSLLTDYAPMGTCWKAFSYQSV